MYFVRTGLTTGLHAKDCPFRDVSYGPDPNMKSYILATKRRNPSHVVIHVGTNDLESDKTPKEIAKDIYDIAQSLKKMTTW